MKPFPSQNAVPSVPNPVTPQEPWIVTRDGRKLSKGMSESDAKSTAANLNQVSEGAGSASTHAAKQVLFG